MFTQKELIKILITTAQDSFEAGYGKPITKQIKENIADYIILKQEYPNNTYRFIYCKDGGEFITQLLIENGKNETEWICLHA